MERIKKALLMIYKSGDNLVDHDGVEMAGYLAFLVMLAFFPFLVFLFSILGAVGESDVGTKYLSDLMSAMPKHIVSAIEPRILEITSGPPAALLTVSILGAIWTSSSIVEGMRTVLNRAYRVHTPPNYYWRRTTSIIQMIVLTLILALAMLLLVLAPIVLNKVYGIIIGVQALSGATHQPVQDLGIMGLEWEHGRQALVFSAALFFVSMLYYILPNVKQSWLRTLPGALIVVIGWWLVGKAYTYYLLHFNQMNLIYGSLANIIAFLVFFYIENIVFIYGAEFNYLLEKSLGHKIEEKEETSDSSGEIKLTEKPQEVPKKKTRRKSSDKNKK